MACGRQAPPGYVYGEIYPRLRAVDDRFFTNLGFWITLAGTLLGIGGIVYGIWARSHPKIGRIIYRINESSLIPAGASADRMRVLLDDESIYDPYIAVIEVVNTGPNDLPPDAFKGGRLRISTTGEEGRESPTLSGNLSSSVTGTITTELPIHRSGMSITISPDPFPFYQCHFDVDAFQVKKGRSAVITLLSSGKPNLIIDASLTDFEVEEVKQASDFELSVEVLPGLPIKIARTRRRH